MIRVSLLSVAAVLAFAAGTAPSAFAKDGVYTSTTLGRNGDVTVQTTITNGRIADVKVLDWSETHPIADLPRVKVPADIVKNQSLGVDVVSGATLTSFAIINGVRDALKQAGLNPADFSKKIAPQLKLTDTVEESADIVIIGAGGAGLSAAVTAAKAGKSVIVMEKTHYAGGNTSVAGGCYNAADPALEAKQEMSPQRRASVDALLAEPVRSKLHGELIEKVKEQLAQYDAKGGKYLFDSVELHALQSWKAGDYAGKLDLVYELAKGAPEMQKELAEMGFKWNSGTEQVVGALWPRSNRASNYKSGVGYIDTFLNEIKTKHLPVTFIMNTAASDILMKDGRAAGVVGTAENGRTFKVLAKDGVILTTGGFSANVDMRVKYDTIWDKKIGKGVMTTNVPSITGDGIKMAQKVGANLIDMGYIQLLPTTDPYTGATNHAVSLTTGIYLNMDGKRFVNELGRRDELARAALAQPGHKFFILATSDANKIDKEGRNQYGIKVADLIKSKNVFEANTWDELAEKAGINKENMKKTIADWNAFCRNPVNDPFGRVSCDPGVRLDGKGPFYATVFTPSVHHTMGGVQINGKAEVLDTKGAVIPGLYAAGEVTGGVHGKNRVGCNAVPDALVFGRIAALNAVH